VPAAGGCGCVAGDCGCVAGDCGRVAGVCGGVCAGAGVCVGCAGVCVCGSVGVVVWVCGVVCVCARAAAGATRKDAIRQVATTALPRSRQQRAKCRTVTTNSHEMTRNRSTKLRALSFVLFRVLSWFIPACFDIINLAQ